MCNSLRCTPYLSWGYFPPMGALLEIWLFSWVRFAHKWEFFFTWSGIFNCVRTTYLKWESLLRYDPLLKLGLFTWGSSTWVGHFFPLWWKLLSEVGLYLIWDLLFLVGLFSYSVTLYRCETWYVTPYLRYDSFSELSPFIWGETLFIMWEFFYLSCDPYLRWDSFSELWSLRWFFLAQC